VYENNGNYYIFKDGKKVPVKNPNPNARDTHATGLAGEIKVADDLTKRGYEPLGGTQKGTDTVDGKLDSYMGRQGIDGIYRDKETGQYVFVEVKSSTGDNVGSLGQTQEHGTQMSKAWLKNHVQNDPNLSQDQKDDMIAQIDADNVKLLKGEVKGTKHGEDGTIQGDIEYKELEFVQDTGIKVKPEGPELNEPRPD